MLDSFKAFLVLCSLAGKCEETTHSIFKDSLLFEGKENGIGRATK